MSEPSMELVVAGVGEIVDLGDAVACVQALATIRELESRLREAKAVLTDAVAEECKRRGTKTLDLPAGGKAVYADRVEVIWDIEVLETLRALGLPEDRFDALVKTEVTMKVDARVAGQLAGANPDYAEVIAAAKTVVTRPGSVTIK